MASTNLISSDPAVMMGKSVVAGTRITVELILEKLGAGEAIEDILSAHPRPTEAGIRVALAFAAEALRGNRANCHLRNGAARGPLGLLEV
jgi:uncharacterized protein (DUF433 family)